MVSVYVVAGRIAGASAVVAAPDIAVPCDCQVAGAVGRRGRAVGRGPALEGGEREYGRRRGERQSACHAPPL